MEQNISSITKLSSSKGGLRSSMNYASSGKPHNSDNGKIKNRCILTQAYNVPNNKHLAYIFMKSTLKASGSYHNKNRLSVLRDIESFNVHYSPKNLRKVAKINHTYIKRAYPFQQSISFANCDGNGHYIHFHNLISPVKYNTLTAPKVWNWRHQAKLMDKTLKMYGYTPVNNGKLKEPLINSSRGFRYYSDRSKSYVFKVLKAVNYAKNHSTNFAQYSNILKNKYHIHTEMFKHTNIKGHRQVKYYSRPSNNGTFKELNNGFFVRYKKRFSYDFKLNNGKHIIIREKKLGRAFCKPALLYQFKCNKKRLQRFPNITPIVNNNIKPLKRPKFKPIIHNSNGFSFPKLKIFNNKSIIQELMSDSHKLTNRHKKLLTKFWNNAPNIQKQAISRKIQAIQEQNRQATADYWNEKKLERERRFYRNNPTL